MFLEDLPNEIIQIIVSNVTVKDAKNFALCSKRMNRLSLDRIWNCPSIDHQLGLKEFIQFPIRKICSSQLSFSIKNKESWQSLKKLKTIHTDQKEEISAEDMNLKYINRKDGWMELH